MATSEELLQKKLEELTFIETDFANKAGEAIADALNGAARVLLSEQVDVAANVMRTNRLAALKAGVANIGATLKANAYGTFRGASWWPHLAQRQPTEISVDTVEGEIAKTLQSALHQFKMLLGSYGLKPPAKISVPFIEKALRNYASAYKEWKSLESKVHKEHEESQRQQVLAEWDKQQ